MSISYTHGGKPSPPDARDYRIANYIGAAINLPAAIDMSNFVPLVLNQGNEGTCGAHTMVTVMHRMENEEHRYVRLSPRYAYERARQIEPVNGEGTTLRSLFKSAQKNGVCPLSEWPYTPGVPGTPSPAADRMAQGHRIGAYGQVNAYTADIKTALVYYSQPLGVLIEVFDGFYSVDKNGYVYNTGKSTGEYHILTVVGYDDTRRAFRILNSWGTEWGQGGYGWWSYEQAFLEIWGAFALPPAPPPSPWTAFVSWVRNVMTR